MSSPRVGWTLSGRPPTPDPAPPAEPVLAVGDHVTVTTGGTSFEATVTAVTQSGGGVVGLPPATDPAPAEPPAEQPDLP